MGSVKITAPRCSPQCCGKSELIRLEAVGTKWAVWLCQRGHLAVSRCVRAIKQRATYYVGRLVCAAANWGQFRFLIDWQGPEKS